MASRINTRFLLILCIAVMSGGGLIGGLWYLQMRGDAVRSVRAGDVAMESGNFDLARRSYGRAVRKEPGRRDYLAKLEHAILDDTPETIDKAQELYRLYLTVLHHEASHFPRQAESHLRTLREMHHAARLSGQSEFWLQLANAADAMWNRVDPADPRRIDALLYRGLGTIRRAPVHTRTDLETAEQDLLVYVEALPESDLGWASLAESRMAIAAKLESEGQSPRAEERMVEVDATLRQALQHVPDGPHVHKVLLTVLASKRSRVQDSVSDEEMQQAMDRAIELAIAADDPRLAEEVAITVRRLRSLDGLARADTVLRRDLELHPDDQKNRLLLAETQYYAGEIADAAATAEELLTAPLLKAGLMAQAQFEIRRLAAAMQVDVSFRRWEQAPSEEKGPALERTQQAHDRLVGLVGDPQRNPLVMKADAKLALANNDVRTAAGRFEQYLAAAPALDFEVLAYSAICQQRLGQLGLAHDRISQAVELQPQSVGLWIQKANLEIAIGRFDDAAATAAIARRIDPDRAELDAFDRRLAALRGNMDTLLPDDPQTRTLREAQEAFNDGDIDTSRGLLLGLLESSPRNVRLLVVLGRLEFSAGGKDAARAYFERALEIDPANQQIWGMMASLDNDDPVAVMIEALRLSLPDEAARSVALVLNLAALADAQEDVARRADAVGDEASAVRAREVAGRAREESGRALALALQIAPNDPQLIEFQFTVALRADNWEEAERLIELARTENADQVDGLMFRARYAMERDDFESAARLFEEVTSRLGYSGHAWKGLGFSYQQLGRTADALAAYEEAYRRNPNDLSTIRRYVPLLMQSGQKMRALGIMRPAAKFASDNVVIRNSWLDLEADSGDAALALHERRLRFMQAPDDVENALALASLLTDLDPAPKLLLDKHGDPLVSSVQWSRYSTSRQDQILQEARDAWNAEADSVLDSLAVGDKGQTLLLAAVRASVMRNRGDAAAGTRILRDFIQRQPEAERSAEMYLTLSAYLQSIGDVAGAVETITLAVPLQDPTRLEADTELGEIYFQSNDLVRAIEYFQRVLDATGSREVDLRIVECLVRQARFEEADQRLQAQIEAGGRDYITWLLAATVAHGFAVEHIENGRMTEGDRRIMERDEALARAEALDPGRTEAYVTKARAALTDYQRTSRRALLDTALLALDSADRIKPGDLLTTLARVDVLLAMDDARGAIGELTRAVEREPRSIQVRRLLIQQLVGIRDADGAIRVARDGEEITPGSPVWPEMLGRLYATVKGDAAAAADAYRRAYELQPRAALLANMVDAELGRPAPDFAYVRGHLERIPEAMENSPVLRTLYARTLDGLGEREAALEQMRIAYRDDRRLAAERDDVPRNIRNWYAMLGLFFIGRMPELEQFVEELTDGQPDYHDDHWLAGVWAATGPDGRSRAIELQRRALGAIPTEQVQLRASLYSELASIQLAGSDFAATAESFRRAIELTPDDATVANNLAYVLAEYLDQGEEGLVLAERAVDLQPQNAEFLDTLGWICFKLGDLSRAEQMLQRSLDAAPSAACYLHLAHVQVANGDSARAERTLRRSLEGGPDAATRAQIDRLLNEIRTGQSGGQ